MSLRYMPMRIILFILSLSVITGCYSFKGITIPPEANTFLVEDFRVTARNAPANINQTFSEALRQKIRNESRLVKSERDPDIVFKGSISRYTVESLAPQEGNTVALNKLTIAVDLQYEDNTVEDGNWKQTFSFFRDFDSTVDLNSVQNEFIDEIFEQLTENIFNKAFTNW